LNGRRERARRRKDANQRLTHRGSSQTVSHQKLQLLSSELGDSIAEVSFVGKKLLERKETSRGEIVSQVAKRGGRKKTY